MIRLNKSGCHAVALVFCTAAVVVGCNARDLPEMGTVSGVVTLDGKPLPHATVRFFPASGRPSQAITRDDGSYELSYVGNEKGALVGEHRVSISTYVLDEDRNTHRMISHPETLPAKYHEKSELKQVVEPKHNDFNFDLTSK